MASALCTSQYFVSFLLSVVRWLSLFCFFASLFFVTEDIHYRGRGSGRLRGLSFSLSLSFPYDQWSIEEQLHNVLPWAKEEGKEDPLLLLLVHLVWLTLRAAAEAAELFLPLASCIYFSLLCFSEWVERSWRR